MAKKNRTQRAQSKKGEQQQSGPSYWQKMTALPIHLRVVTKLRRALGRLGSYATQAERFDAKAIELFTKAGGVNAVEPSKLIEQADSALKRAVDLLQNIPEDYEAPRRAGGAAASSKFVPGTTVAIREKRRAAYADDLTPAEQGQLKVLELRKSKAVCITPGNVKVLIPTAHLTAVQPEPAQQKAARS